VKTVNFFCKDRGLSTTNEGGQWARMPICFFFSTHTIALLLLPADIPFLMWPLEEYVSYWNCSTVKEMYS